MKKVSKPLQTFFAISRPQFPTVISYDSNGWHTCADTFFIYYIGIIKRKIKINYPLRMQGLSKYDPLFVKPSDISYRHHLEV